MNVQFAARRRKCLCPLKNDTGKNNGDNHPKYLLRFTLQIWGLSNGFKYIFTNLSSGNWNIFLVVFFVLPQRKLPEEKENRLLYEERCSANWKLAGGVLIAGGNTPIARVSLYEDFFVVSLLGIKKINYSQVLSVSFKSSWFSKSMTINLGKGRSLVIRAKNMEKIQSIIMAKNPVVGEKK